MKVSERESLDSSSEGDIAEASVMNGSMKASIVRIDSQKERLGWKCLNGLSVVSTTVARFMTQQLTLGVILATELAVPRRKQLQTLTALHANYRHYGRTRNA